MRTGQRGATAVEFALVLILFLTFTLGIIDFARMLFTWSAANEATRAGARYAVVCHDASPGDGLVLAKMQALLPQITNINLAWNPPGCSPATCEGVELTIVDLDYQWISPVAGFAAMAPIAMPSFSTYLTREMMGQDDNHAAICTP